jgi:hypothetical protein
VGLLVLGEAPPGEAHRGRPGLDLDVVPVKGRRHAKQPGVEAGQTLNIVRDQAALREFHVRYSGSSTATGPAAGPAAGAAGSWIVWR